jgi:prepilin-type N-terminal cleavage/methylation domain-containing protein
MKNKKKAFTLTELLIVVIVIGILAALVLPKFTRIMETRKTTEAEEIMAAIRTEQEARCALSKPYTTNFAHLTQVATSLPTNGENQASRETDFSFYYTGECIETCPTGPLSTAPTCQDGDAVLIGDRFICEKNGEWRPVPCSHKYPVRCGCDYGSNHGQTGS